MDKKSELMVAELKRFRMNVTGISETKWFRQEIYHVQGFMILHSGRPTPRDGELIRRRTGVGIVLDPVMTQAWRDAGEVWKAVSSRVVTARLKLSSNRPSRAHLHQTEVCATVISVYAPTHRATPDEKS